VHGRASSEAGRRANEAGMTDLPPDRLPDGKHFLFIFRYLSICPNNLRFSQSPSRLKKEMCNLR
jgi:hypothetical protein